jgi:hypothetical protein
MNKQLSNYIGVNCGALPIVMYYYRSSIPDKEAILGTRTILLEHQVNHKRRIKRELTKYLKVDPRIKTIGEKQMAAFIVIKNYQQKLSGKIKPKEIEPSVKEVLEHIVAPIVKTSEDIEKDLIESFNPTNDVTN